MIGTVILSPTHKHAIEAEPNRIGPRSGGIRRGHQEVAATIDARVDDVERSVVVGDRRREHPA